MSIETEAGRFGMTRAGRVTAAALARQERALAVAPVTPPVTAA